MEIAYKDLFRKNYLTYVPGPAGFFAKKFKESGGTVKILSQIDRGGLGPALL